VGDWLADLLMLNGSSSKWNRYVLKIHDYTFELKQPRENQAIMCDQKTFTVLTEIMGQSSTKFWTHDFWYCHDLDMWLKDFKGMLEIWLVFFHIINRCWSCKRKPVVLCVDACDLDVELAHAHCQLLRTDVHLIGSKKAVWLQLMWCICIHCPWCYDHGLMDMWLVSLGILPVLIWNAMMLWSWAHGHVLVSACFDRKCHDAMIMVSWIGVRFDVPFGCCNSRV